MKKLKTKNKVHKGRNENRFDNHESQAEKYIEEKVVKEAELPASIKKKQAQNNHYQQEMRTECIN